jgi:hypothetical protein
VIVEESGGLDYVVINADENEIFGYRHLKPPLIDWSH